MFSIGALAFWLLLGTSCRPGVEGEQRDSTTLTAVGTPSDSPSPQSQEWLWAPDEALATGGVTPFSSEVRKAHSVVGFYPAVNDSTLALPKVHQREKSQRLAVLMETARETDLATDWRKAADFAVEVEEFTSAHQAYTREAAIYRRAGDLQAAAAEEAKASYYSTELEIFVSRAGTARELSKLARWEPSTGCYVGAFIDRDDVLKSHHFESQTHGDIEQFNNLVEKPHASFFMYRAYGSRFPREWAEYVKRHGAVPHIAWEPRALSDVKDDAYLREFMEEAAALDHPVVLRFASEMNGEWTPYHGDPQAYVKAFRRVFTASRKAPKAVMLWCPNTVPLTDIDKYYPGDDYVDWVGVNFYSVPFLDNDPKRPGDRIHPAEQFKFIYEKYSTKKPMAIGEWAASRKSSLEPIDRDEFSVSKLRQLYAVLPTKYPRIKMVNWYDCNNLVKAKSERQLNDFQLTHSEVVLAAYREAVKHPHYLKAGQGMSPIAYETVSGAAELRREDELRLALKSYDQRLKVFFLDNDRLIHASDNPLAWYLTGEQLSDRGMGSIKILVFDSRDRLVLERSFRYKITASTRDASTL